MSMDPAMAELHTKIEGALERAAQNWERTAHVGSRRLGVYALIRLARARHYGVPCSTLDVVQVYVRRSDRRKGRVATFLGALEEAATARKRGVYVESIMSSILFHYLHLRRHYRKAGSQLCLYWAPECAVPPASKSLPPQEPGLSWEWPGGAEEEEEEEERGEEEKDDADDDEFEDFMERAAWCEKQAAPSAGAGAGAGADVDVDVEARRVS